MFIDETGVNLSLVRSHGRAPRGLPVVDAVSAASWQSFTLIAGLRTNGVVAPWVFSGALNAQALQTWVEEVLLPELHEGDIVVWDNLKVHKDAATAELFKRHGVLLRYTPAYSPDLNPIEMTWSKVKSTLRRLRARTFDTLLGGLNTALGEITLQDCINWFKQVGCCV